MSLTTAIGASVGLYPSQGSWSPLALSGLLWWVRANASQVVNGRVAALYDLSNQGRGFVQVAAPNRPVYVAAKSNYGNRAVMQFDGAQWLDPQTTYLFGQTFSVCFVANVAGLSFETIVDSTLSSPRSIVRAGGGGPGIASIYSGAAELSSSKPITTPSIILAEFNGINSTIRVNSKTPAVTGSPGTDALSQVRMGAGFSFVYPLQTGGFIAEGFAKSGILQTEDVDAIMDFYSSFYRVPLV